MDKIKASHHQDTFCEQLRGLFATSPSAAGACCSNVTLSKAALS